MSRSSQGVEYFDNLELSMNSQKARVVEILANTEHFH